MPTVTLLTKANYDFQLKFVEKLLKTRFQGLRVETKILGVVSRGWVQLNVSGEDEKVAMRYLAEETGLCPTHLEALTKLLVMKGCITSPSKSKNELNVDVGIFSPKIIEATIPLHHLQAQLVDGRKVALKKLIELFGFRESLPLLVKIVNMDKEKSHIEAILSEKQLKQYRNWTKSLLDRLIVLGEPIHEIISALKIVGCYRDIVSIEPLGLFEHSVVCKLGTDASGLIPKIGKNLKAAVFSIFSPKKILEFFGEQLIY